MATTRPISVRLDADVDEPLRRLAQRTRRPLGRVINDLLDGALRMRRFPGIVFMESPHGPVAHVFGTGLDVWELVALLRAYGSVERLLEDFPAVGRAAVETGLAYAAAYPDEIDGAIAENERPMEERLRESPHIRVIEV
jgi:uncharacterized protein (DUF433 family)